MILLPQIAALSPGWVMPVPILISIWAAWQGIRHCHLLDRFLQALFENHHAIWIAIGAPTGWQWAPPSGPLSRSFTHSRWAELMSTAGDPSWLQETPELAADFRAIKAGTRRLTYRIIPFLLGSFAIGIFLMEALDRMR